MTLTSMQNDVMTFSKALFEKMKLFNEGIADLEWYEFDYALDRFVPTAGWDSVLVLERDEVEQLVASHEFFKSIQLKPQKDGHIILDEKIVSLNRSLFKGLVTGFYSLHWIDSLSYFDLRSFLFLARTNYFTPEVLAHFGGKPYMQFEPKQRGFGAVQDLGYKEFSTANREIDQGFLDIIARLITVNKTPFLMTIAGASGAGKTEIVERLRNTFSTSGRTVTSIEMDNFYKDGEFRDGKPLDKQVIHFNLFEQSLRQLMQGINAEIPRYNFIHTRSSHDNDGILREGQTSILVEPADIIFLEGNFPFHIPEIANWIGLRIVYFTDDPVRLKRKWRRDIDYRKKYDQVYFCNRYFRTQFLRAEEVYRPLMEVCDMIVDTTAAAIWLTPEWTRKLSNQGV